MPGDKLLMLAVPAPLLQAYVCVPLPPVVVMEIDPSLPAAHDVAVTLPLMIMAVDDETLNDAVAVQPAASVTVTE